PGVGLSAYTPQYDAGRMTDPPVWLPSASGTISAATAAADPLDEPPGVWAGSYGLRVLPGVRVANSVVTVFPMITAPAALSIRATDASPHRPHPACHTAPVSGC